VQGGENAGVPREVREPVRGRRAWLHRRGHRAQGHARAPLRGPGDSPDEARLEPAPEAREHPAMTPEKDPETSRSTPRKPGYDPDAPIARGEVGKVGVSIASIEDMEDLFEGIPLERVSTSMTINATASILLALYVATAKRRGIAPTALAGTVQNDILKEYIAR